jgi:hypothetical protein
MKKKTAIIRVRTATEAYLEKLIGGSRPKIFVNNEERRVFVKTLLK